MSLESVLQVAARLKQLQELQLPANLFVSIPPKILQTYRLRVATEDAREVRRHPDPIRYTLLAAYCHLRSQELTDTLADLLCDIIHRLETRAEKKADVALFKDLKRVRGKNRLFFAVAEAAVATPDGTVREVVFPVVPEQTLKDLVREGRASVAYDQQVQTTMRKSYCHHYGVQQRFLHFRATRSHQFFLVAGRNSQGVHFPESTPQTTRAKSVSK